MLALLNTSVRYQRPPSAWVGGDGEWTDRDHLLTHAHSLYEAALCPDCGRPLVECESGTYTVQTRICGPSAAVAKWRRENKTPPDGVVLSTVRSEADANSATIESAPQWWKDKHGYT